MELLKLPMVMQFAMMMPQLLQALKQEPSPLKPLEELKEAMSERSRSILGGTALVAAGGMLCLKGSNPDFLLAPATLPRVAEPQVKRLDAPSRTGDVDSVD
eukprot:s3254_g5.t1